MCFFRWEWDKGDRSRNGFRRWDALPRDPAWHVLNTKKKHLPCTRVRGHGRSRKGASRRATPDRAGARPYQRGRGPTTRRPDRAKRVLYQRGRGPNTARRPDRTTITELISSHSSRFNKRLGRTIDLAPSTAFRGMNVETLPVYLPLLIWR